MSPVATSPRVLVIGAGPAAGHLHLPVLARLRDQGKLILAAVCDIERERSAAAVKQFGFRKECGDALAALQEHDIDVVYVLGSAQMHHELGLAALRAGKHLFVEKPVAPSYVLALELAQVARDSGLIAVAGHNRRFYRSLAAVRERMGSTRWRFAEAVFHKPEFGNPPRYGARTWLGANGIHALDALIFMMGGLPESMNSSATATTARQADSFAALMRWRDGAQGVFLCNNAAGSRREEYVFHGPGETCTVNGDGLVIERGGVTRALALPALGDGIRAEHESFLRAIDDRAPPPHSIEAIAPSLYLAELIEAAHCGPIRRPERDPVVSPASVFPSPCSTSILVTEARGVQSEIARRLPHHRLVSLEEVLSSQRERPDITAAILGPGSRPLSPDALARLPSLAVVGVVALSLARHAPEALLARDIALFNASEAYAASVAEFALALAILGRRRAFISHEVMRRGGWGTDPGTSGVRGLIRRAALHARPVIKTLGLEPTLLGAWRAAGPVTGARPRVRPRDLRDATAGLIGWGANARALALRLVGAHARVIVYSEHASPAEITEAGATVASLAEALSADVVSLHRGLRGETLHGIGAAELDKLRPGSVLINIARGALIDPKALLARLRRGDILACLDTFEVEPPHARDALRRLPNVFLTSHIAGGSPDMHAAAAAEVVGKVAAYLEGHSSSRLSAARLRTMT